MTGPRSAEERISLWLEQEAVGLLPDRVLDATFEETRDLRQASRSGWRPFSMSRPIPALIAVGHRSDRVLRGRLGLDDLDLRRPASSMTALVRAGIDEQSTQPGVEALRIAEARQVAPGMDECLLHGILGHVTVSEDQACDREEAVGGVDRERLEGAVITALGRLDEASIHPGPSGRRPTWSPEPYDGPVGGTVQNQSVPRQDARRGLSRRT